MAPVENTKKYMPINKSTVLLGKAHSTAQNSGAFCNKDSMSISGEALFVARTPFESQMIIASYFLLYKAFCIQKMIARSMMLIVRFAIGRHRALPNL